MADIYSEKTISLNANTTEYWTDIKRRAKFRKALEQVNAEINSINHGLIYEKYVADVLRAVQDAAYRAGIETVSEYTTFLTECAEELGLPELLEDPDTTFKYESEAVDDVINAMGGYD